MAQPAQLFNEQRNDILFPNRSNNESVSHNLAAIFSVDSFYQQPTAFYYNDRARLQFIITSEFAPHFILIKGLIEFARPNTLKFKFKTDEKHVEIDLALSQFEELMTFLPVVYLGLQKELKFKAALKKAIQFEEKYKRERDEVYSSVF